MSRPKIQDTSELEYDSTHIFLKPKKSLATLREWNKPLVSAKIELALPKIHHITSKPAAPLYLQMNHVYKYCSIQGLLIFLDIIKMPINIICSLNYSSLNYSIRSKVEHMMNHS